MKPKSIIIEIVNSMGYEAIPQGTLPFGKKYPDNFFTYFNIDTTYDSFYDNENRKVIYEFWLFFYSCNPKNIDFFVEKTMNKALEELKKQGFIIKNPGEDVTSDVETHLGKMATIIYIEKKEETIYE